MEGRQDAGSAGLRIRNESRSGAARDGLHAAGVAGARSVRRRQGCARQRAFVDRRRQGVLHLGGQGVHCGRYAPRSVAGGVGDSRRPSVRAFGGCVPDGSFGTAALNVFCRPELALQRLTLVPCSAVDQSWRFSTLLWSHATWLLLVSCLDAWKPATACRKRWRRQSGKQSRAPARVIRLFYFHSIALRDLGAAICSSASTSALQDRSPACDASPGPPARAPSPSTSPSPSIESGGDADHAAAEHNRIHIFVLRFQAVGLAAPSTLPLVSGRHNAATITSR